jgi:hypothetical protein
MAERNPLYYTVSAVYSTKGTVTLAHRYDTTFSQTLTLTDLAYAAGKFGNQYGHTTYLRLWDECKNRLIRLGYVPVCEESAVRLRKPRS